MRAGAHYFDEQSTAKQSREKEREIWRGEREREIARSGRGREDDRGREQEGEGERGKEVEWEGLSKHDEREAKQESWWFMLRAVELRRVAHIGDFPWLIQSVLGTDAVSA